MDNHYDFEIGEIKEETEEERRRRRRFRKIAGLIMGLLMLSFVLPFDILISLTGRETVEDSVIELPDFNVIFAEGSLEKIQRHYVQALTETKMCFTGQIINGDFIIEDVYIPTIFRQTPISVSSEFCDLNTIIAVHTHPFERCLPSEQDVFSHSKYSKINPQAISAVMCDLDKFAFYGI